MSITLIEQILVYAAIPAFTVILALLVFLIAKFQFNLSFPGAGTSQESDRVSLTAYICLALLLLFFVFVAYVSRRRQA